MAKMKDIKERLKGTITKTKNNEELTFTLKDGIYEELLEKEGISLSSVKELESFNAAYVDSVTSTMGDLCKEEEDLSDYRRVYLESEFGSTGSIRACVTIPPKEGDNPINTDQVLLHTEVLWKGRAGSSRTHNSILKNIRKLISEEDG